MCFSASLVPFSRLCMHLVQRRCSRWNLTAAITLSLATDHYLHRAFDAEEAVLCFCRHWSSRADGTRFWCRNDAGPRPPRTSTVPQNPPLWKMFRIQGNVSCALPVRTVSVSPSPGRGVARPALRPNKSDSGKLWRRRTSHMARDEEYLLYPIDTGEEPVCLRCTSKMLLAGSEVRPGKAHRC